MSSVLVGFISFIGYLLAYRFYGRFLSKKIFSINKDLKCPSQEFNDGKDYVPSKKTIVFGHHFTSIAGLGPIVGPAIAIIWGWVPALLWVFLGSIFMGAVHDFGSLVIGLRNQGRSIGDIAGDIINKRVRTLILVIIFFELLIAISVFALIVGLLFHLNPSTIIPVWSEIPFAMLMGYFVYKKNLNHFVLGLVAALFLYGTIVIGTYFPVSMPGVLKLNPIVIWVIIMLAYSFIASVLPVTLLLQPRDYINSHQLLIAMIILIAGVIVARPEFVAPAINVSPEGAPPIFPFIFVIIACGAISGFHCLVSSSVSSKQCESEKDALFIGYGAMLAEAFLSTLVIIVVGAAIGMGLKSASGEVLTGVKAFTGHYASWSSASGLTAKLKAFITGSANLMDSVGIPMDIAKTIMGVFLISFAITSLDTATRIQRYVVSEIGNVNGLKFLQKTSVAGMLAVLTAALLAFHSGTGFPAVKKAALTLWPLFGTVNQLLASMALFVITIYLARKRKPLFVSSIPLCFMLFMTGWAMVLNLKTYYLTSNWLLLFIGIIIFSLEIWMILESFIVLKSLFGFETSKQYDIHAHSK